MADQSNTASVTPANPHRRRVSIVEMFSPRANASSSPPANGTPSAPDVAQHRRGASISNMGLTGSGPGQASPFNAFARQRAASISTSSAASSPEFKNSFGDGPAVLEEEDDNDYGSPSSPSFARRVSFGAQALKDVKAGSVGIPNGGEGFNWSESLRDRTKRAPSFSTGNPFASRTKSFGVAPAPEPPREMPKAAPVPSKMKKPDHLGERMLRGDFMMD